MRYRFFSYNQAEGQTTDEYVTELKSCAQHCEFGELKTSLIRDKVVIGVYDMKVQERWLRESELSLDTALQICRAAEEVKKQSREIKGAAATNTTESTVEIITKK